MTDEELGVNIRKMRSLKGLSQENMAESLKISQKSYSRIENGQLSPTFKTLVTISEILEIEFHRLFNFNDSIVFNNVAHHLEGGAYNAYNNTEIKFVQDLYERLLAEKDCSIVIKDKLIKELESKITSIE